MALGALVLRVGAPVLLAGAGVVAVVTAPSDDASVSSAATMWIDSPLDSAVLDPGPVTVVAHAADGLAVDEMHLEVDGTEVASQTNLDEYDRLAGVTFEWEATEGFHVLVVSGDGESSAPVTVSVGENFGPDATTTTTVPTDASTTTAETTTTITDESTTSSTTETTLAPTTAPLATNPPPTTAPPTTAPGTTAPVGPMAGPLTIDPAPVQGADCANTVRVTSMVRNVTRATLRIRGADLDVTISASVSGNTATATFRQRELAGRLLNGEFNVFMQVAGPTGSATSPSYRLTISC